MNLASKVLAAAAFAALGLAGTAATSEAAVCASTTNCTLYFTQANSSSGQSTATNWGSVTLSLSGAIVSVSINLNAGMSIINTGFPNGGGTNFAVAFNDTIAGLVNVTSISPNTFSGFSSQPTQSLQFDGFGSFNNAVGTTSLGNSNGVNSLSFNVAGATTTITDVNQLLAPSIGGGDGAPYIAVDVNFGSGQTGLIGAFGTDPNPTRPVPEPATMALFGAGLAGLGLFTRRRRRGA